ncbi:unnamed protein product [Rhodiola kirilowii]
MEEMKKDLLSLEDETMSHNSEKIDISMATSSHNIFQDSQDVESNIDEVFEELKETLTSTECLIDSASQKRCL